MGKPVWIRFVLVPGLTDDPRNIEQVAYRRSMTNVEWVSAAFHRWASSWVAGWSIGLPRHPRPATRKCAPRWRSFAVPAAVR